jgi:nucleoside-diphosphate-sugar epimerase
MQTLQHTLSLHQKNWLVVGAGWLGLPLAEALAAHGAQVTATNRKLDSVKRAHPRLQWQALDLDLPKTKPLGGFEGIVLAFPPSSHLGPQMYAKRIAQMLELASADQWVLMSSTGVYPQKAGFYDENAEVLSDHAVVLGEKLLQQAHPNALIFRAGGLAGLDRRIGRHFANRLLADPWQAVNLVHQADVISASLHLLQQNRSGIYNVVAPLHPAKAEVYKRDLEALHLPPFLMPEQQHRQAQRIILSDKLLATDFHFSRPDPMFFY